jgi:hypothetical protein
VRSIRQHGKSVFVDTSALLAPGGDESLPAALRRLLATAGVVRLVR